MLSPHLCPRARFAKFPSAPLAFALLIFPLLGSPPSPSSAQGAAPRVGVGGVLPVPAPDRPVAQRYEVGPDDVVTVTVVEHPGFSANRVVVPQNGLIFLPVVGTVKVTGKTLEQLDAEITRRMKVRLKDPEVVITLETPRPMPLYVGGQVRNPGILESKGSWRISEVLAAAGGLTVPPDNVNVSVNRANRPVLDATLGPLLKDASHSSNMFVKSGDVIQFYEKKVNVSVTGAVQNPGYYSVPVGGGVALAVSTAGGAKPNAALTQAMVHRSNGTKIPVNLYRLLVQGQQTENLELQADDIITIPEARGVTVLGEVTNPGAFPLEAGKNPRISDALAAAGGLRIKPELATITVSRGGSAAGLVPLSVDAVGLLQRSEAGQNIPLQDGDIVTVAAYKRNTVFVSGQVRTPGAYDLQEGDGIAELVTRAGGPTPDASLGTISVTRKDGNQRTVNAATALLQGKPLPEGKLVDGDVVVVPKSDNRILIVGAVETPGSYALPEDRPLTVGDALSLAGGARNNAKKITLLRPVGDKVETKAIRLDKPENGSLGVRELMLKGDVLWVPEGQRKQSTIDRILNFLPGFAIAVRN